MNSRFRALSAAVALAGLSTATATAAQWAWQGGCGGDQWYAVCTGTECLPGQVWHWNNWHILVCGSSGVVFPGSLDDVFIDGTAYLDRQAAGIHNLEIASIGELKVRDGGHLTLSGPLLANEGTLWVQYGGWAGDGRLTLDGTTMLQGGGALRGEGALIDGAGELQVSADQTIRGHALTIDVALDNAGTLAADVPGTIHLNSAAKANSGVMQATGGGTLSIRTRIDQTSTGKIRNDGGTVQMHDGARIVGGRLESAGESACLLARETATLENCENYGKIVIEDGATLAIVGSPFRNEGQMLIRYGGWAGNAYLRLDSSPVRFVSNGEIAIAGGSIIGGDYELASSHTIRGYNATISASGVNEGLIHADTLQQALSLRGASTVNRGTIKASGGGIVRVYGPIDQDGDRGRMIADNGSVEFFNGAAVAGGTLETPNNGAMNVARNTVILTDVVNAGTFNDSDGAVAVLRGSLTNNGAFNVSYGGWAGDGYVSFETNGLSLHGSGVMSLAGARLTSPAGESFRNTANHTIRGYGLISAAFENEGLIFANVSNTSIKLEGDPKISDGVIRAGSGAYIDLSTPLAQTVDGQLRAEGGAVRLLNGSAVSSGTLITTSGGVISADFAESRLENVTNQGSLRVGNGGRFVLTGNLTNNGSLVVYYGGWAGNGHLELDGNVSFAGTGTVTLENGDISGSPGAVLTNGANHTLTGGGPIGVELSNDGVVAPGVNVGSLSVNGAYSQLPTGVLRIELAGTSSHDQLAVSGAANVGGAVEMKPVNGFIPRAGQQYTVLTSAALTGLIADVRGPGRYSATNVGNDVVVAVVNGPGDVNCDGFVTVGDIRPFVTAIVAPDEYPNQYPDCELDSADVNGDGYVTVGDVGPFVALVTGG